MKALFSVPFFALGLSSGLIAEQPVLDQVVSGDVLLTSQPNGLLIEQTSQEAWLDWQQFSIAEQQVVQFLLADENGLTVNRVTGNEVSSIFGQLQSNGTVYLINPNGILFSESAQVDVGGLFVSDHWLDETLGLTPSPGSHGITVFGQIHSREQLTLLANELTQAGTLQAGNIQLLGNASALLQLDNKGTVSVAVPATGGDTWIENSGVMVANDQIYIGSADTNAWLNNLAEENNVSVSGDISAPRIDVYGSTIEVIDAQLQAELMRIESQSQTLIDNAELSAPDGEIKIRGEEIQIFNNSSIDVGSGKLTVGGELQGKGADRNAEFVFVSQSVDLIANAGEQGDGGEIIVWSDGHTEFHGRIEAKGGELSGDGGFAEVSGKETLTFRGDADLTAAYGRMGTLLLDPEVITVVAGNGGLDDAQLADGEILRPENPLSMTISEVALEILVTADIRLEASQAIIFEPFSDGVLSLSHSGTATFNVVNSSGEGSVVMQNINDKIVSTNGGGFNFSASGPTSYNSGNVATISLGDVEFLNGGNLIIQASSSSLNTAGDIDVTIGNVNNLGNGNILISALNQPINDVGSSNISIGAITIEGEAAANRVSISTISSASSNTDPIAINLNGNISVAGNGGNEVSVLSELNGMASGAINVAANVEVPNGSISFETDSLNLIAASEISTMDDQFNPGLGVDFSATNNIDAQSNSFTIGGFDTDLVDFSKFTNLNELSLITNNSVIVGGLGSVSQADLTLLSGLSSLAVSSLENIEIANANVDYSLQVASDLDANGTGSLLLSGLIMANSNILTTSGNIAITESLSLMNNDFIIESGIVTIANGATDLTIDADLNFTNASSIGLTGNAGTTVTLINRGDTGGNLALQNVTSTNTVNLVVHNRFNLTNVSAVDLNSGNLTLWAFGGVELSDASVNNLIIDIDRDNNGSSLIDLAGTNSVNNLNLSGSSSNDSVQWDGIWTISGDLTTSNLQNFQLQNLGFSAQSVDLTGVEQLTVGTVNASLASTVGDVAFSHINSGTFDLSVNAAGNLSLASADFTSGSLSLVAGGALTVTDANTGTGNLSLTATGASELTNGSGNLLTLNSSATLAGNIQYNSISTTSLINLENANLTVESLDTSPWVGVELLGSGNTIATNTGNIVLDSVTAAAANNLTLDSAGGISLSDVNVGLGNLVLSSVGGTVVENTFAGALTLNSDSTITGFNDFTSTSLNGIALITDDFSSASFGDVTFNGASNSITTTVGDLVLNSPTVNNSGNLALTSAGDVVVSNLDVGSGTITVSGDNLLTDVVANGDWAYDRLIVDNANSFTSQASLEGDRLTSVTVGADITLADGSSITSDRVVLNAGGNIAVTGVSSSSPNIPSISISAGDNITDGGNSQEDIGAYWIYGLELAAEGSIADSLAINYQVGTIAEDQLPVSDESSTVINSSSESKNPVQSSQASIGNLPRNNVDLYVPECNAVNRECRKNNAIRKFLGALLIGGALPE